MKASDCQEGRRVSVVIPCRNYGHFLQECLDSLYAQSVRPYEILVVDDGSEDDTPDVIQRQGDRIRHLRLNGRGAYGARNESLKHLSGNFFLNVDADNLLEPCAIEALLASFETHGGASVAYVYPQRHYFGDREGVSTFPEFDPERLLLSSYVDMGALIRMPLVKQFGFDEWFNRGCGDHAFFLKLLQEGYTGVLVDQPLLQYRVHGESITHRVRANYDQLPIQRHLCDSFPDLYTEGLRQKALEGAANRTLVSIIHNRSPDASFSTRFRDLMAFIRVNPRHAELWRQIDYLLTSKT